MTFTLWSISVAFFFLLVIIILLYFIFKKKTTAFWVYFLLSTNVVIFALFLGINFVGVNPIPSYKLYINSDYYQSDGLQLAILDPQLKSYANIKEVNDICLEKYHEKASAVIKDLKYYYDFIQIKPMELKIDFSTYLKSMFSEDGYALAYQYNVKTIKQSKYVSVIGKLQKEITNEKSSYSIGDYKFIDNQNKLSGFTNQDIKLCFVYKINKKVNSKYISDFKIIKAISWKE